MWHRIICVFACQEKTEKFNWKSACDFYMDPSIEMPNWDGTWGLPSHSIISMEKSRHNGKREKKYHRVLNKLSAHTHAWAWAYIRFYATVKFIQANLVIGQHQHIPLFSSFLFVFSPLIFIYSICGTDLLFHCRQAAMSWQLLIYT